MKCYFLFFYDPLNKPLFYIVLHQVMSSVSYVFSHLVLLFWFFKIGKINIFPVIIVNFTMGTI
jgi:hypothetical protein